MRSNLSYWLAAGAPIALFGCGMVDGRGDSRVSGLPPAPRGEVRTQAVADFPVKIGEAYQVGGKTYQPADALTYDEVGYASWYGDELRGGTTANGERFAPDGISAAHRTLPLPSYVEITALDTGKTILVRVNDRGPFSNDRVIDLSQGAARQLGIEGGNAPVRVRRVSPPEQERAMLRQGQAASARLETPPALLNALRRKLGAKPLAVAAKPMPRTSAPTGRFIVEEEPGAIRNAMPRPQGSAARGGWYVQIGAFSSQARAQALATRSGARADPAGAVYRVRYGPFSSEAEAKEALRSANGRGYREARVLRDAGG